MPPLTPLGRKAFELDTRKLASDIIVAFLAQALSIASSVATTLILPKFLGIESFGYWQLFLFYVSYIGFFHLGINDGVYLSTEENQDHGSTRRTLTLSLHSATCISLSSPLSYCL